MLHVYVNTSRNVDLGNRSSFFLHVYTAKITQLTITFSINGTLLAIISKFGMQFSTSLD